MRNEQITSAEQEKEEYGYRLAFRLAAERLAGIADIEEQCRKTEARYLPSRNAVAVDYLDRPYLISLEDGSVSPQTDEEDLPMRETILILHYFTQAGGTPLSGRMITYQELHDGINYYPVFAKRAIQPLVRFFGERPERLMDIAAGLGGQRTDYGDVAATIPAFRRTPITFALWRGDDEFPPEGNILFDSTISDYLTNDDIHNLSEAMVWRMVKLLKAGGDSPDKGRD